MSQTTESGFLFRDKIKTPARQLKATVTQAGTAAPAFGTTFENSLGDGTLTWARSGAGAYTLTASGIAPFTAGKTFVQMTWGGTATTAIATVTSTTVLTFAFGDSATPSAADLAGTLFLNVEVFD